MADRDRTSVTSPPLAGGDARRMRLRMWARSQQVRAQFRTDPPIIRWLIAGGFCLTIVGIPVGLGIFIGSSIAWSNRKRKFAEFVSFIDRSRPLWVYVLMANSSLLRRRGMRAPALVIGSFQPALSHEYFAKLCSAIFEINDEPGTTPDHEFVRALFQNESFVPGRRRRLPDSLTGDVEVYAFDLMIDTNHLIDDRVSSPLIPCVAEGGSVGQITTVPFEMVGGVQDWLLMSPMEPNGAAAS